MLTDATDPAPEPSDAMLIDSADPILEHWIESLVVEQGTSSGRMALIRALARILARLDREAQAMPQSAASTHPDESLNNAE